MANEGAQGETPFRAMCEAWEKNRAALNFIHTISLRD